MPDTKITALTAIGANPIIPATFPIPMVDLTDTSMAASGTTKKVTVNQILGAGGTATLASATITGDLTVDTSTLKVDSTNNRVGIGTASPVASFQATLSGLYGLCIQSADTNNSALNIGNDPTSGYAFIDATKSGSGSFLPLRLSTSDNERIRIETAGDVKIVTGNVVMATSGKGIDFSATASGSGTMTSELLDDYEEGTWTGTLTGGTTNPTIPVTATGRYTKIGRVVTVQIYFDNVNTLGASGLIGITGLPFTNNASVGSTGSPNFYNIATFTGSPFLSLGVNQSFLSCYSNISNSAFGNVTHNASASTNYLTASITYTVA
jgi:hypothetical protein